MKHTLVTISSLLWLLCIGALAGGCTDGAADVPAETGPECAPDGTPFTVWVANQTLDTVTVFRNHGDEAPITPEILATISVGRAPHNLTFSPDRRFAWVAELGTPPANGQVQVIDTQTYAVVATIESGVKSHGISITPDGAEAWVANVGSDDITVIDTATLTARPERIAVGDAPALAAFLPDGSKAYVSNGDDGTTSVVDVASHAVIATIPTGLGAMGLAVSADGRFVYETEGIDNQVSMIDTSSDTVANVLSFNGLLLEAHGLAMAGGELLITNRTSGGLAFVNMSTLTLVGSVDVPGRPDILAVSPDCHKAYLTLRSRPAVAVVDIRDRRYLDNIELSGGDLHGIAVLREAP